MSRISTIGVAAIALAVSAGLSGSAWAVNDKPFSENWAPSEWGKDDKAGSVNRTTAAMVLILLQNSKFPKIDFFA